MCPSKAGAVFLTICSLAFSQQQPRGVRARSSPGDYAAQVTVAGITYAASLLPADEVKHLFAFDISKTYVVFEVAVFPRTISDFVLNADSFVVRSIQTGDPVRRADSATVASVIQQKNAPPPNGSVIASAEIGYESGRDPVTGRRRSRRLHRVAGWCHR